MGAGARVTAAAGVTATVFTFDGVAEAGSALDATILGFVDATRYGVVVIAATARVGTVAGFGSGATT